MKRTILVVLAFVLLCAMVVSAVAEQMLSVENGTLVVRETKETMRVPGVPDGLTAKEAYELFIGQVDEVVVTGERKASFTILSLPPTERIVSSSRAISYNEGKWMSKPREQTKENPRWALFFFWQIGPALVILLFSLMYQLAGKEWWKLIGFYVVLLIGAFAGIFIGGLESGLADLQAHGMEYFVFLAVVMTFSFIIAKIVKIAMDRYFKVKSPATA